MGAATYTYQWPLSTGATFAVYKPELIIPTPANFLTSVVADQCDIVLCVPVFVEAWAQDPVNIAAMKNLDALVGDLSRETIPNLALAHSQVVTGASLDKSVGDMLAEAGVILHSLWGSTETGPATMILPREMPDPREWQWFRLSTHITFQMKQQDHPENVFEPIVIPTKQSFPATFNTTYLDKPAFSTGDLLERHPSDTRRWRVYGRRDEQIMLSTGDNVNPLAM
ncbi:hypothetical protein B0H17DRAFT_1147835, partial [Mycena rosella]